jgi:DNA-binding response OmpR family regulator
MSRRLQILLVTPNVWAACSTRVALRVAGYDVRVRSTFESGARCLVRKKPDLLIADVRLGAFNGLHLAMRSLSIGIPAIVVGGEDAVLKREAGLMGATYLTAPVDGRALMALVESLASMALPKAGHVDWAPATAELAAAPGELPREHGVTH